jgi:hypothetical protein
MVVVVVVVAVVVVVVVVVETVMISHQCTLQCPISDCSFAAHQ